MKVYTVKHHKFWLMYLDLMEHQHLARTAVQENDYHARLYCWEYFLKFYFALNKTNYARYGSFYTNVLRNINLQYPGLLDILINNDLSVQAQDKYPLRTAVDQRGEQTLNKDAKSGGGIINFVSNEAAVLKWTLNRPKQAENTRALIDLSVLNVEQSLYKPLRPSQVLKSEAKVQNAIIVMEEEYRSPFDKSLDKSLLYHLSSGITVLPEIATDILSIPTHGLQMSTKFKEERLLNATVKFHDPISRNKFKLFKDIEKKLSVTKNNTTKVIKTNRNVLGTLLACTAKYEKPLDFEKVEKLKQQNVTSST